MAHALEIGRVRTPARSILLFVALVAVVGGCRDRGQDDGPIDEAQSASDTASAILPGQSGADAIQVSSSGTATTVAGSGVIIGRLVDAVTGLPVPDAGVTLLGTDRRAITGADGRFRFDGVAPGKVTIVFGPVADHIARSIEVVVNESGADLGVTPLLPAGPPTLIVPEFGGVIAGCKDTKVTFATAAVVEAVPVRITCLAAEREFPAPPPEGRLPLAALDLAPSELVPATPARISVALPAQPQYAQGVALDLLRLDLERLAWAPAGTLLVDQDRATASGDIAVLGSYMVVAPTFGSGAAGASGEAVVQQFRLSAGPDGAPTDVFPTGTVTLYALFDYAGMDNTRIAVHTVDGKGVAVFESVRQYSGQGGDHIPMVLSLGASWPPGDYRTTLLAGDPPAAVHSIAWRITRGPTAVPPVPTVPWVPDQAAGAMSPSVPIPPPPATCRPPLGWFAYVVRPGDTLTALAARTGSSVSRLRQANCLPGDQINAGAVIYLPVPPAAPGQPGLPPAIRPTATRPPWRTPVPTAAPPVWPTAPYPTTVPPWPPVPTTWFTPGAATAPVPTSLPVPTLTPQPTAIPLEPTAVPPQPTATQPPTAIPPQPTAVPPPTADPPTEPAPPESDGAVPPNEPALPASAGAAAPTEPAPSESAGAAEAGSPGIARRRPNTGDPGRVTAT